MWLVFLAWLRRRRAAEQLDPAALVDAACAGDRVAAVELARRIGPAIRARVLRITRGRPTAATDPEDMVQAVWERLFAHDARRLRAFDASRGVSIEGFASMIAGQAVAEIIAAQTAQKRRAPGGTTDIDDARGVAAGGSDASVRVEQRGDLDALWGHLESTLPPQGALVLRMLFVDRAEPAEIARLTGMKRATVDSWKFKIKKAALAWRKTDGGDPV